MISLEAWDATIRSSLRRNTELRGLESTAKTASVSRAVCATRVCARQFERLSATNSRRHHTRARRENDIHVVFIVPCCPACCRPSGRWRIQGFPPWLIPWSNSTQPNLAQPSKHVNSMTQVSVSLGLDPFGETYYPGLVAVRCGDKQGETKHSASFQRVLSITI